MKSQLDRTENYIRTLTGKTTKPYFRPPYGAYNTTVLVTVGSLGYTKTIKWNIDTIDWDGRSTYRIVSKVLNNIVPGSIVLMHDCEPKISGCGKSGLGIERQLGIIESRRH